MSRILLKAKPDLIASKEKTIQILQPRSLPKIFSAVIQKQKDGTTLLKAQYEVGQVSPKTGLRKVGTGKWEPVKDGDNSVPEEEPVKDDKEPEEKDEPDKKDKKKPAGDKVEKFKTALKDAVKGIVDTMTDVFAGRGGGETAAGATQQEGRDIKEIGKKGPQGEKPETKPEEKREP